MDLPLDERGVDPHAAVVDRPVSFEVHLARPRVDLDDGCVGAEGEGVPSAAIWAKVVPRPWPGECTETGTVTLPDPETRTWLLP